MMNIKISDANRTKDSKGTLLDFDFTVIIIEDDGSGNNLEWHYKLTPSEIVAGDVDLVIKQQTALAIAAFSKFAYPIQFADVKDKPKEYIGAKIADNNGVLEIGQVTNP